MMEPFLHSLVLILIRRLMCGPTMLTRTHMSLNKMIETRFGLISKAHLMLDSTGQETSSSSYKLKSLVSPTLILSSFLDLLQKTVQLLLLVSAHGLKSLEPTSSRMVCGMYFSMKTHLLRPRLICLRTWEDFSLKKLRNRWLVLKSHLTFMLFKILSGVAVICLLLSIPPFMKRS